MGELACRLATESIFGEDLMAECTVQGIRGKPLPPEGIAAPQEIIVQHQIPLLTTDSAAFRAIWKTCIDALNHACSKLRRRRRNLS